MNFNEFYNSRNHRIYINWYNQPKRHNMSVVGSVSRDLVIKLKDVYFLDNEDHEWMFAKYMRIVYNTNDLQADYNINPSDAEVFPCVIVSSDGITWSLTGIDETFSYNSIKFIGTLLGFDSSLNTETHIHDVLDLIAGDFNFEDADDYLQSIIRSTFECIFYQTTCEKHRVNKSTYLNLYYAGGGQLTEECDVINPSILVNVDTDYPDFLHNFNPTYVYISHFKRYYFINKITNVRKGLWRLDCHVDVLYTYNTDIRNQSGLIVRGDLDHVNNHTQYLIDDRLPLADTPNITYSTFSLGDVYKLDESLSPSDYTIALFVIGSSPASQNPTNTSASDVNLPTVKRTLGNNPLATGFALDNANWKLVLDEIINQSSLAGYVVSCVAFPYALNGDSYVGAGFKSVQLKDVVTSASGYWLQGETSHYIYYGKHTFTQNPNLTERFADYEPYTMYELYLPYYGWYKLIPQDVLGCEIRVYYVLDYTSGNALIIIYNKTKSKVIKSMQTQVGILLATSQTNKEELEKQKASNTLNTTLGVVASTTAIAGGILSSNPIAVAGGVVGIGSSVLQNVNRNLMMIEQGSSSLTGDRLGLYLPKNEVIVKITTHYVLSDIDTSVFAKENGYPNNCYDDFTTLSGYSELVFHYIPSSQTQITTTEISEIEELAKNGIIL